MESRNRKPSSNLYTYPSSPLPNPPSSSSGVFRDVSNLRTPQNPFKSFGVEASPRFFTATKRTPSSVSCSGFKSSAVKSKAARKLKAIEIEQLKSARKVQLEKEKSLKSLSRSLTVWLNFLFENPSGWGCDPEKFNGGIGGRSKGVLENNGKRGSSPGSGTCGLAIERPWRAPKRHRDSLWRGEGYGNEFSDSTFSELKKSLQEICSFEDLTERMRMYLSLDSCKEIFEAMTLVAKNIDEGRLKMRASCPIVSDVGMKEKALRILMCYNPFWLRIGLYVIFGGDSLLPTGDVDCEQERSFLRILLERQLLAHPGLAKAHAYNKLVEGLYRPGYYEKLGNVILKRFLLLVIILDRAKSQASLPIKYGIDGVDGGSPLLFSPKNTVKSSRDLISEFLSSDVMHGEGNVVTHLVIVGYKVNYQQSFLIEYDFKINDLFKDMQDGIRLCRAVGLLKGDPSIFVKVVDASDTQKKSLANAGIALQYLKQAGVPLSDEDGTEIILEDVVNGDKELTISLFWNIFVHLQLPLLIDKTILSREISAIQGYAVDDASNKMPLDLLLSWIQAVCDTYELKVENHSSLLDGKAMWCLLDYYFRKEHNGSCSCKDSNGTKKEVCVMSTIEYTDAVHNFLLSQKLASLLGNFPEVLQVSDIIENKGACNWKSVIIILAFLSIQLLVKRNTDNFSYHKLLGFSCHSSLSRRASIDSNNEACTRDFRTIMAWWQDMAQQNGKGSLKPVASSSTGRKGGRISREHAAIIIQSYRRKIAEQRKYVMVKNAALTLQQFAYAWLVVKKKLTLEELVARQGRDCQGIMLRATSLEDRHYFVNMKRSGKVIQQAIRCWIARRRSCKRRAVIVIQQCIRGWLARSAYSKTKDALQTASAIKIQRAWKEFLVCKSVQRDQHNAAVKIQSHYVGWLMRRSFTRKKLAVRTIHASFRHLRIRRNLRIHKEEAAATVIQSHFHGYLARCAYSDTKTALQRNQHNAAVKIQSHFLGWLIRRSFTRKKLAVRTIQTSFRSLRSRRNLRIHKEEEAAAVIQSHVRGYLARSAYSSTIAALQRDQHNAAVKIQSHFLGWLIRSSFIRKKLAVRTIQTSFLCLRSRRNLRIRKEEEEAATIVQSHFRGWLARKEACRERDNFINLQGFCRGWMQRKNLLLHKKAATKIQSTFRCMKCRNVFISLKHASIVIQATIRGENTMRKLTGSSYYSAVMTRSVVKLQKWWRYVIRKKQENAATLIQLHFRDWMAKQMVKREVQGATLIQSYWKGYLARKHAKAQLVDLRLRMEKSKANVDESRRLINRLIAALSELLSMKSVTNILHTCATLDMATELSQKCCEELVAAGAIGTLLKLIQSMTRSIPDQQVLKHAISILRNLARYPHLAEILVRSPYC